MWSVVDLKHVYGQDMFQGMLKLVETKIKDAEKRGRTIDNKTEMIVSYSSAPQQSSPMVLDDLFDDDDVLLDDENVADLFDLYDDDEEEDEDDQ
jgi:hypothetical protein